MNRVWKMVVLATVVFPLIAKAQQHQKERKGAFYFSWGYNKEWYTHSDVKVNQPELNNRYTIRNVHSHDHIGWDEGLFSIPISIPQYNYRLGYFFNTKKGLAFEINFDHTKHIIQDGQQARITGTLDGRQVDTSVNFAEGNGFYYFLNNGANFLLFNLVKRWLWYESKGGQLKIDALCKAGIGPVIPHVQNSLFGREITLASSLAAGIWEWKQQFAALSTSMFTWSSPIKLITPGIPA
ncbi:MAG: hypothetical protein NVSMB63_00240 [Sediminibacterium sp.]